MDSDAYLRAWYALEPSLRAALARLVQSIEAKGYGATVIQDGGDEELWLDVDFSRDGEALGGLRLHLTNPEIHGEEAMTIDLVQQAMGGRHLIGYRVSLDPDAFDPDRDGEKAVSELFAAPNLLQDTLYRLFLEPTVAPGEVLEDVLPY